MTNKNLDNNKFIIILTGIFFTLVLLLNSLFILTEGKQAVVFQLGQAKRTISDTGLHFKMPFVDLGACPEGGSSLLIPQLAGHRKAAEVLMLGDAFNTQSAINMGIVNQQLDKSEVLDFALSKAKALALKPQNALRTTKRLLKAPLHTQLSHIIENELAIFSELLQSEESQAARKIK
jgi:enoyl-CoA hydratase/carnithine racemase